MNRGIKTLVVVALIAVGGAACDDDITGLNQTELAALRAEVALVSADGVFQDLSLIQDPGIEGLGFQGVGMTGSPGHGGGPCPGVGQGAFHCQPLERDGFTIERVVMFFDAGGDPMDAFERGVTDKVQLVMDASGSMERSFWSATIFRHREMTLEGLTTDLHTANGTKTEEVSRSRNPLDGAVRTFDMTGSSIMENIVHALPRAENPYPLSGTITRQVHVVVRENDVIIGERNVTAVITFDGSQFATMTIGDESWQIDLARKRVRGRFGRTNG